MQRQQQISRRFEILVDPMDRFIVWDNVEEVPAAWAGEPLIGLNRLAALAAADLLNSVANQDERRFG